MNDPYLTHLIRVCEALDKARHNGDEWEFHKAVARFELDCDEVTILALLHRLQAAEKRVGELSFDNSIKCFMGDQPMVCEKHPWLQYPHDDCIGPGMPLSAIEDEIKVARERKAP